MSRPSRSPRVSSSSARSRSFASSNRYRLI